MEPLVLRGLVLGRGPAKICAPLLARSVQDMVAAARQAREEGADLVEIRSDQLDAYTDPEVVLEVVRGVREAVGEKIPVIFACRSRRRGGRSELGTAERSELNNAVAATGLVDVVDVELDHDSERIRREVAVLHEAGVKVTISMHDLEATPSRSDIIAILRREQELGADIMKIVVMPSNNRDVLILLDATEAFVSGFANGPVMSSSLSAEGVISRVFAEVSGSAIIFAALNTASTPGQMRISDLRAVLDILHRHMRIPPASVLGDRDGAASQA